MPVHHRTSNALPLHGVSLVFGCCDQLETTRRELRKAKKLTQVQLADALGVQQATVAKYERQSDLLLSTLMSYVRAMGGELKLMVAFPGTAPVALEGLGETEEPQRVRRANAQSKVGKRPAASEREPDVCLAVDAHD